GLQLAWELGYRRVKVQLDSRCAVQILQRRHGDDDRHSAVTQCFLALLERDWEVSLSHVYREGNKCANYIASRGHMSPLGFQSFPVSDLTLVSWIMYDLQGPSDPRLVLIES
ncbi:unnamed protein product, partial [Linum tenue]